MTAIFQTYEVAVRYARDCAAIGYVMDPIRPYRSGWRVTATGTRLWTH